MRYLLIFLLSSIFFTSCDKQGFVNSQEPSEFNSLTDQNFANDLSNALAVLRDGDRLEISLKDNGYEFKVFNKNYDHSQFEARAQRCQGRGIGFAKCVKEAIDKFGCQKITKSGDDYISSDC